MNNMEANTIEYSQWTDESARKFELQNDYFDAVQYQRENVQESCIRLGIPYDGAQTIYRMARMATNQTFKIWQVVGISALTETNEKTVLRAAIITPVMSQNSEDAVPHGYHSLQAALVEVMSMSTLHNRRLDHHDAQRSSQDLTSCDLTSQGTLNSLVNVLSLMLQHIEDGETRCQLSSADIMRSAICPPKSSGLSPQKRYTLLGARA